MLQEVKKRVNKCKQCFQGKIQGLQEFFRPFLPLSMYIYPCAHHGNTFYNPRKMPLSFEDTKHLCKVGFIRSSLKKDKTSILSSSPQNQGLLLFLK